MNTYHLCKYHKRIFIQFQYVPFVKTEVIVVPPSACQDCLTEKVRKELQPLLRGKGI